MTPSNQSKTTLDDPPLDLVAQILLKIPAHPRMLLMRVNPTNVLDEGLRIGEVGRRMNSKVNQSNKVCIESKRGDELSLLSICPSPSSPGPYI
jgi:hypothetical protein